VVYLAGLCRDSQHPEGKKNQNHNEHLNKACISLSVNAIRGGFVYKRVSKLSILILLWVPLKIEFANRNAKQVLASVIISCFKCVCSLFDFINLP